MGGGKPPSHTLPPNPSCTTVTGIAKGHKPPCPPPFDWNKRNSIRRVGLVYAILNIIYPLEMAFNVQIFFVFIPDLSKVSQPWDTLPPGAPEHFQFWRGKTSKGAHFVGGEYPPPTVGTFLKLEYKSHVCRAFKSNFLGN